MSCSITLLFVFTALHRLRFPIRGAGTSGGNCKWLHLPTAQVPPTSQLTKSRVLQRQTHLQRSKPGVAHDIAPSVTDRSTLATALFVASQLYHSDLSKKKKVAQTVDPSSSRKKKKQMCVATCYDCWGILEESHSANICTMCKNSQIQFIFFYLSFENE